MKVKAKKEIFSRFNLYFPHSFSVFVQFQKPKGTNLPDASVMSIITGIMYWILQIVGIAAVIGFAIAGLLYITAGGSEGRIEQAKNALLYSIIGIIVALGGLVAIQWAQDLLGADLGF